MNANRLVWADSLKGILIVLVVLGHAIQTTLGDSCEDNHLWNIIYSFHMPAFMAISGYLSFRPNYHENSIGEYKKGISRRFRQLIVPYVIWTIILLMINNCFSFELIFDHLLYVKGLWFLWVLFFINLIFRLGDYLSQRTKICQEVWEFTFCVLLSIMTILWNIKYFAFHFVAWYFIFYSLGYYLHKYDRFLTTKLVIIIPMLICWSLLAWFWHMHEPPVFFTKLSLPSSVTLFVYRFVTAALAVYILLAVSPVLLNNKTIWIKLIVEMGKLSLGIYTVHFIIIGQISNFFKYFSTNNTCVILFTFVTGFGATWMIVKLISKFDFTSKWLLGKV